MAEARFTGSFYTIQHVNIWDMQYWDDICRFWKEENWRALVGDHAAVGIDTLFSLQMALWSRPLFPDPQCRVGKQLLMNCEDPAMVVADEAARHGMKVWYGLGLWGRVSEIADYQGLSKPWPDKWFQWMQVLAEMLMERYADTESFGGFYMPVELSGDPERESACFREEDVELFARCMRESIRPVIGRTPVFASPAILQPGDYSILRRQLDELDIDVMAYQDLGGRGTAKPEDYERIKLAAETYEQLAPVHHDAGLQLWANCESFSRCDPPTWRPVAFTGDMDRIAYQLKVCSPPVDKVITCMYQGVWNKQTELVNIGPPEAGKLYEEYAAYLKEDFRIDPDEYGRNLE